MFKKTQFPDWLKLCQLSNVKERFDHLSFLRKRHHKRAKEERAKEEAKKQREAEARKQQLSMENTGPQTSLGTDGQRLLSHDKSIGRNLIY
jgi:hypothetical protein